MGFLEFNPKTHRYYIDGKPVPGVSDIIRLNGLRPSMGAIPEEYSVNAASRGTKVHSAIRYYLEDRLDESTITDEVQPYFDQFKRWKDETGYGSHENEEKRKNEQYGYAGTIDSRGTDKKCKKILVDWKTGAKHDWHKIQMAGYMMTDLADHWGLLLYLTGAKKALPHEIWMPPTKEQYLATLEYTNIFRSAVTLVHYKIEHELISEFWHEKTKA